MQELKEIIGKNIRIERNRNDITQFDLAEIADLHPNYIGEIERGKKALTVIVLFKICKALGLSLEEFFQQLKI